MAHQVSSDVLPIAAPIASPMHHQTAFTLEQYQQLFALFGASTSSTLPSAPVKNASMANVHHLLHLPVLQCQVLTYLIVFSLHK